MGKNIMYKLNQFFLDRSKSITRITLDLELKKQFKKLKKGVVLDCGSKHSPYRNIIPSTKYLRLDIDEHSNPDICSDLHNIKWESNYFDTIIATEVLEHLHSPQKAIDEIYRILKPGGICILSTRFIYRYHPDPKDYYRFTRDALLYLFKDYDLKRVYGHGNKLHVLWEIFIGFGIMSVPFKIIFNPIIAKINFKKTNYPLGFIVYAKK